ncbi:hypothetical protein ACIRRH_09575 [Kitasatospora sp. NPDC101235]|uniref:hypothetical protein n=1 Tax=Kitasatospora sp. NPDC101235 TaxID=3364101 RepID=UPI003820DA3A
MSADHFCCRLPGRAVDTCSPEEFGELVPRDRDVRCDRLAAAGLAPGVRRTAVLTELALTENGLHPDPAARLPVHGGGRHQPGGALPGGSMPVLSPEQVATASAFLRASALAVHDLRELRDFFAGAGAAGDAVAVREAE